MIRVALALVRWACDPVKLEVLEGDLSELHTERVRRRGKMRAGWRALWDAASIGLRHSRFTTPAARRRLGRLGLAAAATALVALGVDPRGASTAPARYTINATDPAGRFTLEIENARVIHATMNDIPVAPERLVQAGSTLVIKGGNGGRDFEVALKPRGGITWAARAARRSKSSMRWRSRRHRRNLPKPPAKAMCSFPSASAKSPS